MARLGRFTVEFTIPSDPGKIWVARFTHQHGREECRHIDPLRLTPKHVWMECSHHDEKGRKLHPDHKDCPKVRLRRRCPDPSFTPVQYRIPSGPKQNEFIPVQHITTCHLSHKGSALMLTGQAPCSVKDTYNWKEGVHFSLQRALEKARYCKLVKVKDSSLCPHTPKHDDCPDVGRIIVTEKTKEYDEICEAFWREARVSPSGSGEGGTDLNTQTIPATIIPSEARSALQRQMSRRHDVPHGMGASEDDGYGHVPPATRSGTYHMGTH